MTNEQEIIKEQKRIRQLLHSLLVRAQTDLEMSRAMHQARFNDEVVSMLNRRYGRFYIAAESALFNSLISILYKLFETRNDTVNFKQLLNTLPLSIRQDIKKELDEISMKRTPVWLKICQARNKVVGHQALNQSATEVYSHIGITFAELAEFVSDAQRQLILIGEHFHDTHLTFNAKDTQSFDNLLNDLRAYNLVVQK